LSLLFLWAPALGHELRAVGQIRPPGPAETEAARKIAPRLRGLIAAFRALGITRDNAAAMSAARRFSSPTLQVDNAGRVHVYIYVTDTAEPTLRILRGHGLVVEIVNDAFGIVQGWIPVEELERLAAEGVVVKIRPPSYGTPRSGAVNTQGDAIHRCNQARAAFAVTGAGVKVGVVSTGIAGLAAAQASGDLPAVEVLSPGIDDAEGTAMLEIIHDCAPGAALAFSEGITSSLAFIQSVNALRDAGAKMIVDDIGFFGEPYFEDGMVAQNDRAVGLGVLRVSAAGNDRLAHYQGTFTPGAFDPEIPGTRHDFGGGDTLLRFRVPASPAGRIAVIILQWGNPFGGAGDDYDLCVRQTNGMLLDCSAFPQDGNDDPIEALAVRCEGPTGAVCLGDLQVTLFAGAGRPLELYCPRCQRFDEFNVAADSIFGHPAAPEVLAAAASPASNPSSIEPFSSAGPSTILFPAPEVRFKPDLTGTDGVATTQPGFDPFFGTSAAAPHVAGVAALLMEANPAYQLPAVMSHFIRDALKATAVDLGLAGPDLDFGFGRADAVNAAQNELGKARCEVRTDRSVVPVGGSFTVTVETFPGTGEPWDIYFLGFLISPGPFTIFSVNLTTGTLGPPNVIQRSRPTAPITADSQSFTFTAPVPAEVGGFCILIDPGFTRLSRFSFVPISFVGSP